MDNKKNAKKDTNANVWATSKVLVKVKIDPKAQNITNVAISQ